ncbi:MAG TPA: selenocysteine-specific translation elongation factor [Candidatus Aminicenantes bacterium]|nr:selenocysteine-specific translation elongation factor [Candidatus Aminicenantes bacterium]HRY65604.1 selenocysteine-specific translation elongation factor [Candidatus Aminicenantes bacterium]HRZ72508.1 selenocysteine-specific translation elongation factor [Candidatus Aminicenantes bacterium]
MPGPDHVIIGTAGHIDHGKSALVKALTGTDPDSLPEEKARGMTIELGFVFLDDPDYPKQIVFIDVPGHEKFVKTMAAGASHIDAALLVVAADEGIAVQTREHFDILRLLDVRHGLVALTKCDLVDEARLAEVTAAVRAFVAGSFLDGAPVLPVSALAGSGIAALKAALQEIGRRVPVRPDNGIFRMPIDRVFTVHGFGTVVAGTILGGTVGAGDRIAIFPEGLETRVRGVQVHGAKADRSGLGRRTALNLQDAAKDDLRRGQVAAAVGSLSPTSRLDARLDVLPCAPREIKHRDRVRLHVGTDEVMARLAIIGGRTIAPGASAPVQFVLERPTVALPGDRFVIRSFSPIVTIGGGRVLDAAPEKHKRFSGRVLEGLEKLGGTTRQAVDQMFAQSAGRPQSAADIALKLGLAGSEVAEAVSALVAEGRLVALPGETPGRFLHKSGHDRLAEGLLAAVRAYFEKNPCRPAMPYSDLRAAFLETGDAATLKLLLDASVAAGVLVRHGAEIGLAGREPRTDPAETALRAGIEGAFKAARFAAPLEDQVRLRLGLNPSVFNPALNALLRSGELVRLAPKVIYHRETLEAARTAVAGLVERHGSVTIAGLRDRLELSRKYAQAILEYFDKTGYTRRVEDRHVLAKRP